MAFTDSQKVIVTKTLGQPEIHDAFRAFLCAKIDSLLELKSPTTNYLDMAGFYIDRQARIDVLKEIMAQFRAMHESAQTDNLYNVNQSAEADRSLEG